MLMRMSTAIYLEARLLRERIKERVGGALRRVREEKDGAVLVEYALLIAGLALALSAAIFLLYTAIFAKFEEATAIIETGGGPAA
ncbi:MAG: hypothetical protein ACE5KK_00495 [Candidatus Brocadiales bacterium]